MLLLSLRFSLSLSLSWSLGDTLAVLNVARKTGEESEEGKHFNPRVQFANVVGMLFWRRKELRVKR